MVRKFTAKNIFWLACPECMVIKLSWKKWFEWAKNKVKVRSVYNCTSQVAHQAGAYAGFCNMMQLRILLLPPPSPPPDRMLHVVHRKVTLTIKFASIHFISYRPGWREAPWEKSVLSKNTAQCPHPGPTSLDVQLDTNHEAIVPPKQIYKEVCKSINWTPKGNRKRGWFRFTLRRTVEESV